MNFDIEADPPGPLRILSNIPDFHLAILEGLNGIGKTLTIRLLQLCTGTLPYRPESEAWNSFCENLGPFSITATKLKSGVTIVWTGDSNDWTDLAPQEPAWTRINIMIDGQSADMATVRRHLTVERMAGDEGILDMLASQIDAHRSQLERWRSRFASEDTGALANLEAIADGAQVTLRNAPDSGAFESAKIHLGEARAESLAKSEEVASFKAQLESIDDAIDVKVRLSKAGDIAPGLDLEIESTEAEIASDRDRRDSMFRLITKFAQDTAFADSQRRELKNARRALQKNRDDLTYWLRRAATEAADLGISPEWESVRTYEGEVDDIISDLLTRKHDLDAAPAMRGVLGTAVAELTEAEDMGLGDQILIDDPETDIKFTVTQGRLGMSTRFNWLEGQPPPPEVAEVEEQLGDYRKLKQTCRDLRNALFEIDRDVRLIEKNEARVDAALSMADPDAAKKLAGLEHELREIDGRVQASSTLLARLRHQRGMLLGESDIQDMTQRFQSALEIFGIGENDLKDRRDELVSAYETASAQSSLLQSRLAESQRDVARFEAGVRRTVEAILTSEDLEWLRDGVPAQELPRTNDSLQEMIASIDVVRSALNRVVERLAGQRGTIGGVIAGLRSVSEHLQYEQLSAPLYDDTVLEFFGNMFGEWFSDASVRSNLLPNADGRVKVDLRQLRVIWNEGEVVRTRPLDAFSSGEQAFAYTRARLAALEQGSRRPENRLIALDEFGAFIAHDRLDNLLDYLQSRAVTHEGDQVLVILPLSRDYERLAKETIGTRTDLYKRYAQEVKDRSYVLRVEVG
ncbi:MAG: hypothetical protein WA860_06785 [Acidimicrobiales bacterium]